MDILHVFAELRPRNLRASPNSYPTLSLYAVLSGFRVLYLARYILPRVVRVCD
jgi:hypothetical protein